MNNKLHACISRLEETIKINGKILDKQIKLKENLIRLRTEKEIEDSNDPLNEFPRLKRPITRAFFTESFSNESSV